MKILLGTMMCLLVLTGCASNSGDHVIRAKIATNTYNKAMLAYQADQSPAKKAEWTKSRDKLLQALEKAGHALNWDMNLLMARRNARLLVDLQDIEFCARAHDRSIAIALEGGMTEAEAIDAWNICGQPFFHVKPITE